MTFARSRLTPLKVVVTAILFMNVADAAFTIAWTSSGLATEANPLLDDVLTRSPVLFMLAKLALVSLGIFLLFRLRRQPLAHAGLYACGCVYISLLVYHVTRLSALLG